MATGLHHLLILLLLVALAVPSPSLLWATAQPSWSGSTSPQINPPPIGREGSVYGNDDSEVMVFAGGVNLLQAPSPPSAGATFTAFSDIWTFNISVSTYTKSQSALPTPLYFATGGWSYDVDWLVIYSGRTNTRDHQAANTYFSHVYIINCYYALRRVGGASMSTLAVSTLTLSPVPTPRQHAGSFVQNRYMFVLGGVTGATGTEIPADPFLLISLDSGAVRSLPTFSANFPSTSVLTPVLFASSLTTNYLYVYGGGANALGTVLAPTDKVYVYRMDTEQWLTPLRPHMEYGPATPHTAQPSLIYSAITYSRDLFFISMLGGARVNGISHNQAVMIVTANLTVAPETASPMIYVAEGEDADQWSTPRQRGATGVHLVIDQPKNMWLLDFYIYGGASYTGLNTPVTYSTDTSVWTILGELDDVMPPSSSSSSSLSSGAVAGIVIGVAAFVALAAVGLCYWVRVRKAAPEITTGPQSDAADTGANSDL